jgi:hypothetical protein
VSPSSHQDIQELLGAFALDAVDDDERDLVEAHLAGCPRCRAEVATHRETAALLAHGGDRAPEGVWTRIIENLEEPAPEIDLTPMVTLSAAREERERRGRRSISLRTAAALAAVAAAVTAFFGWRLGQQDQRIDRFNDKFAEALSQDGLRRAAIAAVGQPDAEQLWLKSPEGGSAVHLVRLANGTGFVISDGLSSLPPDRTYQLWAITRDNKVSLGLLGQDPDVAPFNMVGPVLGYAITDEVAAGVKESTQTPVVIGWTDLGQRARDTVPTA